MRNKRSSQTLPTTIRAVGYIRVSTEKQVQEGVSLDAQRSRLKAHCVSQNIKLVDMIMDDGYSAKSLDRPGLRAALGMLTDRKADAIVVVKLDRITRSVRDLGYLCDTYFREGLPYYLLSVSDAIDTRSAGGKLILNVLMSVAQWERELRSVLQKWFDQGWRPRHRKEVKQPILDNWNFVQVKFLSP